MYYALIVANGELDKKLVRWWCDSEGAITVWKKQSSTHVPTSRLLSLMAVFVIRRAIVVEAVHIRREQSVTADMLTHGDEINFCRVQGAEQESRRTVPRAAVGRVTSPQFRLREPTSS